MKMNKMASKHSTTLTSAGIKSNAPLSSRLTPIRDVIMPNQNQKIYIGLTPNPDYQKSGGDSPEYRFGIALKIPKENSELTEKLIAFSENNKNIELEDHSSSSGSHFLIYLRDKDTVRSILNNVFKDTTLTHTVRREETSIRQLLLDADTIMKDGKLSR